MMSKMKSWISKYGVEFMVGLYLLYSIYINRAGGIYGYVNAWYVIDYSYGFGSRLLIGSLIHLLAGDFITNSFAYHFVVTALCILCVLLALVTGYIYRKAADTDVKKAVLFLTVFYLASPASPAYLWTGENMGRLDTYLFLIALLMVIVFLFVRNIHVKYLLFIALGVLAVSIHQVYVMLFFPSLLVMMIQDVWKSGFQKRQLVYAFGTAGIIGCVFLYMQFGSGIYYDDFDTLMAELNEHADFFVDGGPIEAEYFWTLKENFCRNMVPEIQHHLKYGFILICMLVPVWGTYLWIWVRAIRGCTEKLQKAKYILMLLTNLAYIPVFAMMNDWGRWFAALFAVNFLNILVLAGDGDQGMCDALRTCGGVMAKNPAPFILFILYVGTFEKFEGLNFPEQVTSFYYNTYYIKEWILGLFH